MPHFGCRVASALLLSLTGCQDSSGPLTPPPETPPGPHAARLRAASPTAFVLLPGEVVPKPEVTVSTAGGERLPNVPVRFTALGGGYVTATVVQSNAAGGAATTWVLGIQPGINILLASVGELPPVAFIAEGGYESTATSYGLLTSNQLPIPTPGVAGGALLLYGNGTFTQHHVLGSRVELATPRGTTGNYVRNGATLTFSGPGASWSGTINGDTVVVDGHADWDPASYILVSSVTECTPETASPTDGEGVVYTRLAPHRYPRGALSSFELRPDHSFSFRYHGGESGDWHTVGQFTRSDSTITFNFGPTSDEWLAIGTTRGRSLTIAFDWNMSFDGYEDGVYATDACITPQELATARLPDVSIPSD